MENAFTSLERDAWGGFLAAYHRINNAIENDLQARCQISHVEFEILLRLSMADGNRLRIQDLAARSILSRSGTSRLVDRLEKSGFVIREKSNEDKRGANAVLTDTGRAKFHEAAVGHMDLVRNEFLAKFGDQDLEQLADFWRRVAET